jgi:hypothetical protein
MYLWSEYEYAVGTEDKPSYVRDKIMLGQKWIRRNELLAIDIEPNDSLHIYEKLKGNLKLLKDNIKKYGSKIKREDDENNILAEYDGYYLNNEIFMNDIYNDLGAGYKSGIEEQKNLYDFWGDKVTKTLKIVVECISGDLSELHKYVCLRHNQACAS